MLAVVVPWTNGPCPGARRVTTVPPLTGPVAGVRETSCGAAATYENPGRPTVVGLDVSTEYKPGVPHGGVMKVIVEPSAETVVAPTVMPHILAVVATL
jgi:hypothetical protein